MKIREAIQKQANRKDDEGALDDLEVDVAIAAAGLDTLAERECDGHADDEEEKRKDKIGRRPTAPGCVFERPVDVFPRAGIVYEDHPRDRDPAKHIER